MPEFENKVWASRNFANHVVNDFSRRHTRALLCTPRNISPQAPGKTKRALLLVPQLQVMYNDIAYQREDIYHSIST
jgi:hypothetical protein